MRRKRKEKEKSFEERQRQIVELFKQVMELIKAEEDEGDKDVEVSKQSILCMSQMWA